MEQQKDGDVIVLLLWPLSHLIMAFQSISAATRSIDFTQVCQGAFGVLWGGTVCMSKYA